MVSMAFKQAKMMAKRNEKQVRPPQELPEYYPVKKPSLDFRIGNIHG